MLLIIVMDAESPVIALVRLCTGTYGQGATPTDDRPTEAHRGQYRRWHRMAPEVGYA